MEELEKQLEEDIGKALETLGKIYPEYDNKDEHNIGTPHRVAKMWIEMFKGLGEKDFNFTTFSNEEELGYTPIKGEELPRNWVVLKDIEFSSMCQHHLMPFSGVVHIGYLPSREICGISKLAREVDYFSARPQVQERLGKDIYNFLWKELRPRALIVIIESKHSCVGCRGIKSRNSKMITVNSMYPEDIAEFKRLIN